VLSAGGAAYQDAIPQRLNPDAIDGADQSAGVDVNRGDPRAFDEIVGEAFGLGWNDKKESPICPGVVKRRGRPTILKR
jgi:hypothetical protein